MTPGIDDDFLELADEVEGMDNAAMTVLGIEAKLRR